MQDVRLSVFTHQRGTFSPSPWRHWQTLHVISQGRVESRSRSWPLAACLARGIHFILRCSRSNHGLEGGRNAILLQVPRSNLIGQQVPWLLVQHFCEPAGKQTPRLAGSKWAEYRLQHARLGGGACVQMFRRLRPARLLVESVDICGSPRRLCCLAARRKTIVVIILLQLSGLTPRRERRTMHWWTCPRRYSNNMKPQDR